jgi:hypothetical protein
LSKLVKPTGNFTFDFFKPLWAYLPEHVVIVVRIEMGELVSQPLQIQDWVCPHFARGDRLIMNKAVRAGRADGLFVQLNGIESSSFDTRNLRPHQCGAVFEILRAMSRPYCELFAVGFNPLSGKRTSRLRTGCTLL